MSSDDTNILVDFKELQELDRACMRHDPFYLENNPDTVLAAAKMTVLRMTARIEELSARCAKLEAALKALSDRHDWQPGMGQCVCQQHKQAREALTTNVDEPRRGES